MISRNLLASPDKFLLKPTLLGSRSKLWQICDVSDLSLGSMQNLRVIHGTRTVTKRTLQRLAFLKCPLRSRQIRLIKRDHDQR